MDRRSMGLFSLFALALGIYCWNTATTIAQVPTENGVILESEGIVGDVDSKRRGPTVTVRTEYHAPTNGAGESVKILADAYIANSEYKKYPIRFDWFINRTLFTSQWRSDNLNGPIGIDVPASVATVPFNYTLVATLLHPNREFTTVIEGAAFSTNVGNAYSCTLSLTNTADATAPSVYVNTATTVTQTGNNSISVSFSSETLEDGTSADAVTATGTISLSGETASGTLSIDRGAGAQSLEFSGSATSESGTITAFSVDSNDGSASLDCESAAG